MSGMKEGTQLTDPVANRRLDGAQLIAAIGSLTDSHVPEASHPGGALKQSERRFLNTNLGACGGTWPRT